MLFSRYLFSLVKVYIKLVSIFYRLRVMAVEVNETLRQNLVVLNALGLNSCAPDELYDC